MRRYQPLTKSNGRVPHSLNHNTNPYYGQHGADWVTDTNKEHGKCQIVN